MFEEEKLSPFMLLELPFCELNEAKSKTFLKKFHNFTNSCFNIAIKWKTKQVRLLFPLKDKNLHSSCKIYEGECKYGMKYIGQTKRDVEIREIISLFFCIEDRIFCLDFPCYRTNESLQ